MSGTSRYTYVCAESARARARELVEALGTTACWMLLFSTLEAFLGPKANLLPIRPAHPAY